MGGSKKVRSSDDDVVPLIGAGLTLQARIAAAELLQLDGQAARVIDCYSIEPICSATVPAAAAPTGNPIVVA